MFEYFAPQLMQHMDPMSLHPYLLRHGLVSREDVDYICNPHRTDRERRSRILHAVPYTDPQAFQYFLQSLSEEPDHAGHKYLAKSLREALEKKRQNPYSKAACVHIFIEICTWKYPRQLTNLNHQIAKPLWDGTQEWKLCFISHCTFAQFFDALSWICAVEMVLPLATPSHARC